MIVGVPKEIKVHESQVAVTPEGVSEFVQSGHTVIIEDCAGVGSAISNEDLVAAGATIVPSADEVWSTADLVVGAESVASTYALANATLPFALSLANNGWEASCAMDKNLAKGLNVHDGNIFYYAVAEAHGYASTQL